MPQFDISSFFVQLIWLFITLISFYILLSLYFLPITSQYIKARKNCYVNQKQINYKVLFIKSSKIKLQKLNFKKFIIF
jgi:hypothetical protein